jgi:transcription-repair coupling factor (superfamily II helicase)
MDFISHALNLSDTYKRLEDHLMAGSFPAAVSGLAEIQKCAVIFSLSKSLKKPLLVITSDDNEALKMQSDLNIMGLKSGYYPSRDFSFRDTTGNSYEYEHLRIESLVGFISGSLDCVVATIEGALQSTIPPEELLSLTQTIKHSQKISIDALISVLINNGYESFDMVSGQGQYSHRGGIVDFFPIGYERPIRIEFWGDEIDTISSFDIDTQRRIDTSESVQIIPCHEAIISDKNRLAEKIETFSKGVTGKWSKAAVSILNTESQKLHLGLSIGSTDKFLPLIYRQNSTLIDYFATNGIIAFSETNNIKETLKSITWRYTEDIKELFEEGILCKGLDKYMEDWEYLTYKVENCKTLFLDSFTRGSYEFPLKYLTSFTTRQLSAWSGDVDTLFEDLSSYISQKYGCVVLAGNAEYGQSLDEILRQKGLPCSYLDKFSYVSKGTIIITTGTLSGGFDFPESNFCLITHGQNKKQNKARKGKSVKRGKSITDISDLVIGDYIVHNTHGIGIFDGIHNLDIHGISKDYLKIRYANDDILYVPVTQLDLVSKYIGSNENTRIRVNKLGSEEWNKAKAKVRENVKDIASELIALYSQRINIEGFAFPEDNEWQRDFESSFEFDETDDQLRCIEEIKTDMESSVPMDRLLCGDVGFGKTEVALRAAFKCATSGKQCAILVPTTILAWQHYQTIIKRMNKFPIDVELISRFKSTKDKKEIVEKLKRGTVDIVIGTHRLLSKDIEFRNLGLLIIDEEQRFGVAQKELLKQRYKATDVLTLSATPIPRTLSMSLSGIRDMSIIEEAPMDRHPVQTYVLEYDLGIIIEAIKKELRRGGQVYYLHNDIESISRVASELQNRIPEARIGIGHGQMDESELSEVWKQLIDGDIDVLVCTTIIESGIDVPNVNTLIVENADRMGLSQLHQIRGRVGRSNRRSYAYLTYYRNKILSEVAQKRLSSIKEFTEFGSGFKIAMRDLEIRGAGNVLGGEQHGHMETVGYDMYIKLLNEAVAKLKGENIKPIESECTLDIQVNAHIPESYIESVNLRLEAYRMIADIRTEDEASDLIDEFIDRYGDVPDSVKGLIDIALLRNTATSENISEIKQTANSLLFYSDSFVIDKIKPLVKAMRGRILLSGGAKPYISVSLSCEEPIAVIGKVLSYLK